jgi:hypothetical protein
VRLLGSVQARVLGAIELVDAITGRRVLTPLAIRTHAMRTVRNAHEVHAVVDADGLSEYAATFDLADLDVVPAPLSQPYDLEIADPAGHYLSRRARVHLPRDPIPRSATSPTRCSSRCRCACSARPPRPCCRAGRSCGPACTAWMRRSATAIPCPRTRLRCPGP